jgi:hypothetical protein
MQPAKDANGIYLSKPAEVSENDKWYVGEDTGVGSVVWICRKCHFEFCGALFNTRFGRGGRAACQKPACLARRQEGKSSGRTPVPPEELAAVAGGGDGDAAAAAVSQPGHTEAPLTRADLETAGAKGAEAVLKSLGLGPGDLDRKLSLPSEHGALQNAQLHSLILPSSR